MRSFSALFEWKFDLIFRNLKNSETNGIFGKMKRFVAKLEKLELKVSYYEFSQKKAILNRSFSFLGKPKISYLKKSKVKKMSWSNLDMFFVSYRVIRKIFSVQAGVAFWHQDLYAPPKLIPIDGLGTEWPIRTAHWPVRSFWKYQRQIEFLRAKRAKFYPRKLIIHIPSFEKSEKWKKKSVKWEIP